MIALAALLRFAGMYVLKHGIKKNPEKRWALPDRIFFGYGACHILAGAFLERLPLEGFFAERIVPAEGFWGNHIYVTNDVIAFDYHGYSGRERLLEHHRSGWASQNVGWDCTIEKVDFDLLDTVELNQRKMLGPDQYLHNAIPRAYRFIERIDHSKAADRALRTTWKVRGRLKARAAQSQPSGSNEQSIGCVPESLRLHVKGMVMVPGAEWARTRARPCCGNSSSSASAPAHRC